MQLFTIRIGLHVTRLMKLSTVELNIMSALSLIDVINSLLITTASGSPHQSLDNVSISAIPETSVNNYESTLREVTRAAKKFNNGRDSGADGIPVALLKCAIVPVNNVLQALFCSIVRTGQVHSDWKDSG